MRVQLCLFVVCMTVLACAPSATVDLEAEQAALMQADRDFAADTAERGADGWADWFDASAIMFPNTGRVEGREAIRERMRSAFTPENPLLTWEPESAVVSTSGDLGYTIGPWRSVRTNPEGAEEVLATGNYVTIWRKNSNGDWRVTVDIGNNDPADEAEADAP